MARRYDAYIPPPELRPEEFTVPAGKAWGDEEFFFAEDIFKLDIGIFEDPTTNIEVDEASSLFQYATDVTLSETDHFVGVDTATTSITVTLPLATTINSGKQLVIKDESGNAEVNNIIIKTDEFEGATIDGYSEITITSNYGAVNLYYNGSGWHIY